MDVNKTCWLACGLYMEGFKQREIFIMASILVKANMCLVWGIPEKGMSASVPCRHFYSSDHAAAKGMGTMSPMHVFWHHQKRMESALLEGNMTRAKTLADREKSYIKTWGNDKGVALHIMG